MGSGASRQGVAAVLTELVDYTSTHFQFEEKLFAQHKYEDEKGHCEIHKKLVRQVVEFQEQYNSGEKDVSLELMEFLKDWLINHIKDVDKKYSSFLLSKGVA